MSSTSTTPRILTASLAIALAVASLGAAYRALAQPEHPGRIVILMVWDGLRPDLVTAANTPELYRMARAGVLFQNHHAAYPTVTMANAAAFASGASAGLNGIYGDRVYLAGADGPNGEKSPPIAFGLGGGWLGNPVNLEKPSVLSALEKAREGANLLELETLGGKVVSNGGYLAIIGKTGPTFLFDHMAAGASPYPDRGGLFVTNEATSTQLSSVMARLRALLPGFFPGQRRDDYFTTVAIEQALPRAKLAAAAHRPALIVLWLLNPDLAQHYAGLGTAISARALRACDSDLRRLQGAIAKLGLTSVTDLIVVSDHGFATIKLKVALAELLAGAGLKESPKSADVVVAPNGGSDLIYLSREKFPSLDARRDEMEKIVGFAEAEEWCGPIFARDPAPTLATRSGCAGQGWIPGTFSQSAVGLFNPSRSPDLMVSFRELPDVDNRGLTGPENLAFALVRTGRRFTANRSFPLLNPVKGVVYADPDPRSTTGMGSHGALGVRELQSFCAALGPDFRTQFVDLLPTGNLDLAPTIEDLLGLRSPASRAPVLEVGRRMAEAMAYVPHPSASVKKFSLTTQLVLPGRKVVTTLRLVCVDGHQYLESSDIQRVPISSAQ